MRNYSYGEYRYPARTNSNLTIASFVLLGIGIGALTALLLAPKTGRQMRRTLRRKYENARDTMDDWRDQAGEYYDKGSKWANAAKEKVRPMASRFGR